MRVAEWRAIETTAGDSERNDIGLIRYRPIYQVEHPRCRFGGEFYMNGETKWQRNTLHTPKGDLTELRVFEPVYDSSTARKHFVETVQDYELLGSYLEDSVILCR